MPGRRHTGFKSKRQWRLFFANPRLRKWARGKAHATPGPKKVRYDRLPTRVSQPGRRSPR
jgi:hypothetical protein